jgi:hypothetical protein
LLDGILSDLPAGAIIPTEEIATPGRGCSYCPSRHICPAYRKAAPALWRSGIEHGPLPFDTWGEATKVSEERGCINLEVLDAAGRRVKVHRLDRRHAEGGGFGTGKEYWLFGLSAAPKNVTQGRYFHPRNFFELPTDSSEWR